MRRSVGLWLTLVCGLTAPLAGCAVRGNCWLCASSADTQLSAQVQEYLARSPALGPPNLISVHSVRGVVYLRGILSTPFQVAEAGSIASQTPGVTEVRNLLSTDNSR